MKKYLAIIAGLVIVATGAFVALGVINNDGKRAETATKSEFSSPQACDALTLEQAKAVLGQDARAADISLPSASSDDIEVSQCLYEQPAGITIESIKAQKQASLLVRGAKTNSGADSNTSVFKGANKPANVQEVGGYGESAFWNPEFGQLNVLKNNNWYILSVGPSNPADKKLEDAKTLADNLVSKL